MNDLCYNFVHMKRKLVLRAFPTLTSDTVTVKDLGEICPDQKAHLDAFNESFVSILKGDPTMSDVGTLLSKGPQVIACLALTCAAPLQAVSSSTVL